MRCLCSACRCGAPGIRSGRVGGQPDCSEGGSPENDGFSRYAIYGIALAALADVRSGNLLLLTLSLFVSRSGVKNLMSKRRLVSTLCAVFGLLLIASTLGPAKAQDEPKFTTMYRKWVRTSGGYI